MHFQVSLECCPVCAIWAEIWLFPSMSEYVSSEVLGGLKALATVGAQVFLAVGTQDDSQSTVTHTFHFTDTHALKNMARSYSFRKANEIKQFPFKYKKRYLMCLDSAFFIFCIFWSVISFSYHYLKVWHIPRPIEINLSDSRNVFVMNTQHMRLQVALLISSVIAVRAEIGLLPSVSQNMSP